MQIYIYHPDPSFNTKHDFTIRIHVFENAHAAIESGRKHIPWKTSNWSLRFEVFGTAAWINTYLSASGIDAEQNNERIII